MLASVQLCRYSSSYNGHLVHKQCKFDQFEVILMGKNVAFLSKTWTFLSEPKLLNDSVHKLYIQTFIIYMYSKYIHYIYIYTHTVGQKVFSQPPIVQVLPLKKMRESCNFHHRYTSTMTDKMGKKIQKITL